MEEILRSDLELAHRTEALEQKRIELSERLDRPPAEMPPNAPSPSA